MSGFSPAMRLLVLAPCLGCATTVVRSTTWEQDHLDGVDQRPLQVEQPSRKTPAKKLAGARGGAAPFNARTLELQLLRFTVQRRAAAQAYSPNSQWPDEVQALFNDLLGNLDAQLALPDADPPRRLLIQTRVTAEVERELTERRFGACPGPIADRMRRLFTTVAERLRRSRTPEQAERWARAGQKASLEWPVSPVLVTSGFGVRRDPFDGDLRFHAGLDLWGNEGDLVTAAAAGRVVHAGWLGGYGRAVVVQHAGGLQTVYGHLGEITLDLGSNLDSGSPVGFVGSSGRSTGPHLHFEVRRDGRPIDPHDAIEMQLLSQLSQ